MDYASKVTISIKSHDNLGKREGMQTATMTSVEMVSQGIWRTSNIPSENTHKTRSNHALMHIFLVQLLKRNVQVPSQLKESNLKNNNTILLKS